MNPIIVAGMHRSGTSAVARLIQGLGFNVGSDLLGGSEGNIFGHFEEGVFIRFHDELIARFFPVRAPFCEWLPLGDAEVVYGDADRDSARSIWEAHHVAGGNAWKDPRTSLFLDLWMEAVPDAKAIVCLRHPYQVHRSLLRRGEPFLHVDYSAAILGWTIYNRRILEALARLPRERFIVVDVEAAFQEPQVLAEGLARFLGLAGKAEASKAIAPEAFHFEEEMHEALNGFEEFFPEAGELYRELKQFDLCHAAAFLPGGAGVESTIQSGEARLIEFEERHGLRAKARKMLVRSIAVDRQRLMDLYKRSVEAQVEKDGLIGDLSRLNVMLKGRIAELELGLMQW